MQQVVRGNELPILFSAPMVRAILGGRKTQTRRVISRINSLVDGSRWSGDMWDSLDINHAIVDPGPSPAGNVGPYLKAPRLSCDTIHRVYPVIQPGDVLWVRETWATTEQTGVFPGDAEYVYRATDPDWSDMEGWKWSPCIFMPRVACRTKLLVSSVRPQKVRSITGGDSLAEGVASRMEFQTLWESINGKRPGYSWADNPMCWVYQFDRIKD